MTTINDSTLREYAHAMACAATAEQRMKGGDVPRAYVGDTAIFDQLAKHFKANVRQQQRIESLRVLEFEAGGIVWVHGVAR